MSKSDSFVSMNFDTNPNKVKIRWVLGTENELCSFFFLSKVIIDYWSRAMAFVKKVQFSKTKFWRKEKNGEENEKRREKKRGKGEKEEEKKKRREKKEEKKEEEKTGFDKTSNQPKFSKHTSSCKGIDQLTHFFCIICLVCVITTTYRAAFSNTSWNTLSSTTNTWPIEIIRGNVSNTRKTIVNHKFGYWKCSFNRTFFLV